MSTRASRYTADLNLREVNDAHILALGRVPAKSRVLDLGMADGSVAAMLGRLGCQVWGVDNDPVAAKAGRKHCEDVAVEDLNDLDLAERFAGQRFDVVLMLDVLEHLREPNVVLGRVASVLEDGGWGVISLPNVAHLSVRLALLGGKFSYTEKGLLDRTHLRFFDREGVDQLLAEAKWAMFDLARVTRRLGTTEIQVDDADPDLVRQLETEPEARTYQFVVTAAPLGSPVLKHPPTLPAAEAQAAFCEVLQRLEQLEETTVAAEVYAEALRQLEELRETTVSGAVHAEALRRLEELEAELRQLRQWVLPDLGEQLASIRESSMDRRRQLRHLLEAMQEDTERLRRSLSG